MRLPRRIVRSSRRTSRGVASIEFALILLPFTLLLLGMIDYGWYFFVDLVSTNAVREGARAATTIAGPCPNAAASTAGHAAITNYFTGLLPAAYVPTVTLTCATVGGDPQFRVALQLDFPQITGFSLIPMPRGAGSNVRVQTSATMRGVP
jgi:Flp pilus assembly protein TadG